MRGKANIVVGAIVALVVVAAVAYMAVMRSGAAPSGQLTAVVHASDGKSYELPLAEDGSIRVSTDLGANTVVVQDGAVFVGEADCDNQDCVHQGSISAPGKQIICLPHKLWIEVVADGGQGTAMDVNAVAGDSSESEGASGSSGAGSLDVVAR